MDYMKAPIMYSYDPQMKPLYHMIISEISVLLWREVLSGVDMLVNVYYKAGEELSINLPGWGIL